jgi:hypothetical protein
MFPTETVDPITDTPVGDQESLVNEILEDIDSDDDDS